MKKSSYSYAKLLTLIPVIVLAVTVRCMVLAAILAAPTNNGTLYSIFAFTGLMSMFILPFPCLIISVIGTVFGAKAVKEGTSGAIILLILGIIEILVSVIGALLAIAMIIAGQGV